MDCGVPFCHTGCPLGNIIPDWNDLVYRDHWREALDRLHATNNFPEFTGRVCPAPCEAACVLGINEDPVAIKQIEMSIADRGFDEGWIVPEPPTVRTGKNVAVIGSGPAGLAAAQQLNRAGHHVTVFERADRPGGLLMYGIPDFKLEKSRVWRRIEQMEEEGVEFVCNANVGVNVPTADLRRDYDAMLLTGGATHGRDLPIPGRDLQGRSFRDGVPAAAEQSEPRRHDSENQILATGKDVIVIGGGDTGSDCDGTSNRQGCRSLTQFELLPQPPDVGIYPRAARAAGQHALAALADDPAHQHLARRRLPPRVEHSDQGIPRRCQRPRRKPGHRPHRMDQRRARPADLQRSRRHARSLAVPVGAAWRWASSARKNAGPIADLNLELDPRGNVKSDANYMTSVAGVFAAGDLRRGQSLVVWAIHEGREAARAVDKYLMGVTHLPSVNAGDFAWKITESATQLSNRQTAAAADTCPLRCEIRPDLEEQLLDLAFRHFVFPEWHAVFAAAVARLRPNRRCAARCGHRGFEFRRCGRRISHAQ